MKIHELNAETSYVIDPVASRMGNQHIRCLKNKYVLSSRRRHRFCFHQNANVDLHDIIICYDRASYIPPNKHIGKVESLLLLAGELEFYLFSDTGMVYDFRRLSTSQSGQPFYIRVPHNTWHGLRAVGDEPCIIKETISGPYDNSSLQWAEFAPSESEGSEKGFNWYDQIKMECERQSIGIPEEETFQQVNENVFRTTRQLLTVNRDQLKPVFEAAIASPLKRARLCCHSGPEEKLQEMFIVLAKDVDIQESVHLRKDESLTVIAGTGRYLFLNEDGTQRVQYSLGVFDENSREDRQFFTRINRYVPHKIEVESDFLLIHEATTGPFQKADTDYRIKLVDQ